MSVERRGLTGSKLPTRSEENRLNEQRSVTEEPEEVATRLAKSKRVAIPGRLSTLRAKLCQRAKQESKFRF